MTFSRTEMMEILDLRLLGFYKIKQEVLQEHLGRHYHFELADDVCDQYNRFVNLMRKEEESSEGKFPWLDDTDERKYMTDREILDKYVNLDNSCLTKIEKEQVRELIKPLILLILCISSFSIYRTIKYFVLLTSFHSLTWPLHQVCMGKCLTIQYYEKKYSQ